MGERLVKSSERVRDLGEVFTPSAIVKEMLDLLPPAMWAVHPSPTFLEPACGDGNFLVAILERKLASVAHQWAERRLPAGASSEALAFHALEALSSIYAVDISPDNILGGALGHEVGARTRLLAILSDWAGQNIGKRSKLTPRLERAAAWVVEHNLIVGNMLATDASGRPTRREAIPIVEYLFAPTSLRVTLRRTTFGEVVELAQQETALEVSLFGPVEPVEFWQGKALDLADAEKLEAPRLKGPARNGARGRS